MKRLVVMVIGVVISLQLVAQELPRRISLGFRPIPVDEARAQEVGLKKAEGIWVGNLSPDGTMAAIGTKQGDVVLKLNGTDVNTVPQLLAARNEIRAWDPVKVQVWREGEKMILEGKALPLPMEESAHSSVIYGQFAYKGGLIRTIINKPHKPGVHPTIFFIPGYTCSSVDNLNGIHPYRKLVDSLVSLGYAVFRIEKPGIGDNLNTGDCQQLGFDNELEAYVQAYPQMEKYDFIDKNNIFLWGHSMGGIYAPIIASKTQPKGVAIYGIIHDTWTEYLLRMVRYQNPRLGSSDYVQTDKDVRKLFALLYEHYHLGKSSKELYQNPDYQQILERDFAFDGEDQILYRHEDFWREIYKYNLSEAWASFEGYVLSINGEADLEVVNNFSQKEIIHIVNHYHPGKGTFVYMPKTDHSMIKVGTLEEGARLRSQPAYREYLQNHFNYDIVTETHEWIQGILRSGI
ncbi:MAG: PDZ domain-containing protein [Chitinophagales bacterium]|nr:PDZ domain-containing protein [Chitinophagales bacterium]